MKNSQENPSGKYTRLQILLNATEKEDIAQRLKNVSKMGYVDAILKITDFYLEHHQEKK